MMPFRGGKKKARHPVHPMAIRQMPKQTSDFAKRLLELVADPAANGAQCENSIFPTKSGAEDPTFANTSLSSVNYRLNIHIPAKPRSFTNTAMCSGMCCRPLSWKATPDEAVQSMVSQLKVDLGEDLKIVE